MSDYADHTLEEGEELYADHLAGHKAFPPDYCPYCEENMTHSLEVVDVEDRQIATARVSRQLSVDELKSHVEFVHRVISSVMVEDTDYGKIPGVPKKSLFLPGAQKLCLTFHFSPTFDYNRIDLPNGHREYEVTCNLTQDHTRIVRSGVGSASTMEGKYRYRWDNTGRDVPSDYWNTRDVDLLGGPAFTTRKVKNAWKVFQRVEHDNPADYYNTVLKMAKKRAYVDATLNAIGGASDLLTQDVEDMPQEAFVESKPAEKKAPEKKAEPDASWGLSDGEYGELLQTIKEVTGMDSALEDTLIEKLKAHNRVTNLRDIHSSSLQRCLDFVNRHA